MELFAPHDYPKLWASDLQIDAPLPIKFYRDFVLAADVITKPMHADVELLVQKDRDAAIRDFLSPAVNQNSHGLIDFDKSAGIVFMTPEMSKLRDDSLPHTLEDVFKYIDIRESGVGFVGPYNVQIKHYSAVATNIAITSQRGETRTVSLQRRDKKWMRQLLQTEVEARAKELLKSGVAPSPKIAIEILDCVRRTSHQSMCARLTLGYFKPAHIEITENASRCFSQLLEVIEPDYFSIQKVVRDHLQKVIPS